MIETAILSTLVGSVSSLVKGGIDSFAKAKETRLNIELIKEERASLSERLRHERLVLDETNKNSARERFSVNTKAVFEAEEKSFQIAQAKTGVATYVRPILLAFLGYSAFTYAGNSIEFQEDIVSLFVMASSFYFGARISGNLK